MKRLTKYWNKVLNQLIACVCSLSIFFISCQEPDPFPNTPNIKFNNLTFVELIENGTPDSLILSFDFEDGDGDLGIEGTETYPPFHDFSFICNSDEDSSFVSFGQNDVTLPFLLFIPGIPMFNRESGEQTNYLVYSQTDTRPAFSCLDYDTLYVDDARRIYIQPGTNFSSIDLDTYHKDTLYIERNRYADNILVKFFRKRGIDNYEEIDWRFLTSEYGCGISFDGRFPILDFESTSDGRSLQGTINYAMVSTGFRTVLRKDTFNIKFQIFDRSLNESNWAETGDITLDQLIR